MEHGKIWRHFDFALLGGVVLLIILGIAMIRSTTLTSIAPSIQQSTSRQIIYAVIGIGILIVVSAIDSRLWSWLSGALRWWLVLLLIILTVLCVATCGARRWIV